MLPTLISSPWKEFDRTFNKYTLFYNLGIGLNYQMGKYHLSSGTTISERGNRVNSYAPDGSDHYYNNQTFLEFPIVVSYSIFKNLKFGLGLQAAIRLGTNITVVGEHDQNKCLDFKALVDYNLSKRFSINSSYVFGNIDKLIRNTKDTYLHSVFALNLNVTIL